MALGAFVAGLVINESEYAHQALSDIVPLRDVFGMLFFVSVGMLLDPALVWEQIGALVLVVIAIVVGKAAILAGVVRAFGYWNVVPLAVGLTLFQVGEFAFVLARVGLSAGAIDTDVYTLTLNAAIVTMVLTPAVSGVTTMVYERLWPRRPREAFEAINLPRSGLSNHVLVAGWGRVGRSVGDFALAPQSALRTGRVRRPPRTAGPGGRSPGHLWRRQPDRRPRSRRCAPRASVTRDGSRVR